MYFMNALKMPFFPIACILSQYFCLFGAFSF